MKYILISIFLITTNMLIGQTNDIKEIDSLKKIVQLEKSEILKAEYYNDLCELYKATNPDSAILYGNKCLIILDQTNKKTNIKNQVYFNIGVAYLDKDIDKAGIYIQKSLKLAKDIDNDSTLAANYLVISTYYSRIPKLDSSIYYNLLAIEIFQEQNDSLALAYCYYTLMSNYNDLNNNKKTLEYGNLCYSIAEKKNLLPLLSHVTIALGFTYTKIEGEEILANKFITEAKERAKVKNNYLLLSNIYLTLGAQKFKNELYNEAISDYEKAFEISMENNDKLNASRIYSKLAYAYFKLNKFDESAVYYKKDLAINRNTAEANKSNYLHLAYIYANKDKVQHKLYSAKFDSISDMIEKKSSEELLVKYETTEKEKEIEILKVKEIENELLIQKKNFRNIVLFSALILIGLLFSFLYYSYHTKQKFLTQEISLEKQRVLQTESELALKIDALKNNHNLIDELKNKLKTFSNTEENLNEIVNSFEKSYVSEKQWDKIIIHFKLIEKDFLTDLEKTYTNLTKNDIKLSILSKLNYSNQGMAEILNITVAGVKKAKQRLKKKIL